MSETLPVRIIHMHDIEANWDKIPDLIPKQAEMIVYDPDYNSETQTGHAYPRFKIGDGITAISALPFSNESLLDASIKWDNDIGLIDGGKITS